MVAQYSQTIMLQLIDKYFSWVVITLLLVGLNQRKIKDSKRKQGSLVWLCVLLCVFQIFVSLAVHNAWPGYSAAIVAAILVAIGFFFRSRVWPFRLHCACCGKKLDWEHIVGHDDNLCQECWDKRHPEEAKAREEAKRPGEKKPFVMPAHVDDMDWDNWEPTDICVITYLLDGDKVLLIDKKRGLGTGYVNAPGGHIEEAELADDAARREFKEETGLTIGTLSRRGELFFQFKDGLAEHAYVYVASGYEGKLTECEETRPFWWEDRHHMPFDRMWADDILWVPAMMEGKKIKGYFLFDGKTMVDSKVEIFEDEPEEN